MTILFQTEKQFYDGILQLAVRGLTFTADADKLMVKLTGGF